MTNDERPTPTPDVVRERGAPTGLLLTFALGMLVAYQTFKMDKLPSFDVVSSMSTMEARPVTATGPLAPRGEPATGRLGRTKLPLSNLTFSEIGMDGCPVVGWMADKPTAIEEVTQRIPAIIHQTSRFRCVPDLMANVANVWRDLPQYTYYFHDDVAIWRLLHLDWPEFPHLHTALKCIKSMTAVTDIWRLLVLWEYGGIYADIDCRPNSWKPSSIRPDDDSYFVVEFYDAPSQYFMAAKPRHPLIFYSIQVSLANILGVPNNLKLDASQITGPMALLGGLMQFTKDGGHLVHKPVRQGLYTGAFNHTVRIEGRGRNESDGIIVREAIRRGKKVQMYGTMNMTHFLDDLKKDRKKFRGGVLGRSCQAVAYDFEVGPPASYVAAANEDRKTIMGTTR